MNRLSARRLSSMLLYGFMIASPVASAVTATGYANLGMRYTDNATLAAANEIEDQLLMARLGGTLNKTGGATSANAVFSVSREEYLDDTFGTRNYLQLGSSLLWEPAGNRFRLEVQDFFNQTAVDNLASDVPSNRQNTNAFSLAANISQPLADRHSLTIRPTFRDYQYNKSDTDNQQLGLSAGWSYQFRPTVQFSLTGGATKVEFDSNANIDYDSKNVSLAVSGTTARMRYSASIGETWVDRVTQADSNGLSANLSVKYEVSSRSTLQAHVSQDITSSSDLFLGYSIDPATGDIANVQISGEAVRNRSMRVSYTRKGTTVNTDVWTELRKLNYTSATPDRTLQEFGARLGYKVAPAVTASLNGRYLRSNQTAGSIVQKDLIIGAGLGYKLSRRLGASFAVNRQSRDSELAANEYDELNVSASLDYSFWP